MRKKLITAIAVAGVSVVSFAGGASAAPRDGQCVAANLSALPSTVKSSVAKSSPAALAAAIQLHLDGDLDLLGVCSD
jgi:hypothetical protein